MATIYLRSTNATADVDDGSTWALAKTTLTAALTAAGVGGIVYVSDNHAETTAGAITLASPGTAASPVLVLCVDDAAEPPIALATTATVTTTGNSSMTFNGFCVFYGLSFYCGLTSGGPTINLSSSLSFWLKFERCLLSVRNTGSAGAIGIGVSGNGTEDDQGVEFVNTTVKFAHIGQKISVRAPFTWSDTVSAIDVSGSVPDALFITPTNVPSAFVKLDGVDLSALGSGKALVDISGSFTKYTFRNCKLGTSVSVVTGTHPGQGGSQVDIINCDSGDTNYRNEWWGYQGNVITETTIVRTGGANDGTTAISRKMTSSADSKFYSPLVFSSAYIWNNNVGSEITATVHIMTDNVTLTDKECWLEVEYMGTSGSTKQSLLTDRASDDDMYLGTGTSQATSTEAWTTTDITTPVYQKLSVPFTPQEKGPIRFRVMLAKPSTTVYVCPEVGMSDQSSAAQYQVAPDVYLNAPASGGGTDTLFNIIGTS